MCDDSVVVHKQKIINRLLLEIPRWYHFIKNGESFILPKFNTTKRFLNKNFREL